VAPGVCVGRAATLPEPLFMSAQLLSSGALGIRNHPVLRFCAALRKDPLASHIPIIMISGNEQATGSLFDKRTGADDFRKKPLSRLNVFARIERLLHANVVPWPISATCAVSESSLPGLADHQTARPCGRPSWLTPCESVSVVAPGLRRM
jgi:hypothetical protein